VWLGDCVAFQVTRRSALCPPPLPQSGPIMMPTPSTQTAQDVCELNLFGLTAHTTTPCKRYPYRMTSPWTAFHNSHPSTSLHLRTNVKSKSLTRQANQARDMQASTMNARLPSGCRAHQRASIAAPASCRMQVQLHSKSLYTSSGSGSFLSGMF